MQYKLKMNIYCPVLTTGLKTRTISELLKLNYNRKLITT